MSHTGQGFIAPGPCARTSPVPLPEERESPSQPPVSKLNHPLIFASARNYWEFPESA
jgi:hypothetical protein